MPTRRGTRGQSFRFAHPTVAHKGALPSAGVLGLSVLTFFANMVDGSVNDWSTLYLSTVRGFSVAEAASGFALFSLAMAICPLAGGPVVARLGEQRVIFFGGVLIAVGMAVVRLLPLAIVSPFGFALVAVGAANTIPVMMGAASRVSGVAASTGIAATATGALLGFIFWSIKPIGLARVRHWCAWTLAVAIKSTGIGG